MTIIETVEDEPGRATCPTTPFIKSSSHNHTNDETEQEQFLRDFSIDIEIPDTPTVYTIPPRLLPMIDAEEMAHIARFSRGGFVTHHSREFVARITQRDEIKFRKALQMIKNNDFDEALFVSNTFMNRVFFQDYQLSIGAERMLNVPNAGGNSELSEALSYELFARLFNNIRLNRTEMEINYKNANGKRTDYSIFVRNANKVNNKNEEMIIGVSVTRAMKYRGEFTLDDADRLLRKKLYGVLVSNSNVIPASDNHWNKQILHIWCEAPYVANRLRIAYNEIRRDDPEFVSNTIIVATVAENAGFIFSNKDGVMNMKKVKKDMTPEEAFKLQKDKIFMAAPLLSPGPIDCRSADSRSITDYPSPKEGAKNINRGILFSPTYPFSQYERQQYQCIQCDASVPYNPLPLASSAAAAAASSAWHPPSDRFLCSDCGAREDLLLCVAFGVMIVYLQTKGGWHQLSLLQQGWEKYKIMAKKLFQNQLSNKNNKPNDKIIRIDPLGVWKEGKNNQPSYSKNFVGFRFFFPFATKPLAQTIRAALDGKMSIQELAALYAPMNAYQNHPNNDDNKTMIAEAATRKDQGKDEQKTVCPFIPRPLYSLPMRKRRVKRLEGKEEKNKNEVDPENIAMNEEDRVDWSMQMMLLQSIMRGANNQPILLLV